MQRIEDSLNIDFASPYSKNGVDMSNIEENPYYKSIAKIHANSPVKLVPVPTSSSPVKKDRKLPLFPIKVEMNALQLLKPAIMDALLEFPYASAIFLHCFVEESTSEEEDEKSLIDHIILGFN